MIFIFGAFFALLKKRNIHGGEAPLSTLTRKRKQRNMKKILYSIMALAMALFTLQSCEDVPAPYDIPENGDTPDKPVVEIKEITCAQAMELCNALEDGATSEETYSITGYITDVFETVSRGQQSFWLSDQNDGQKMVQAYWANLPEGVESFTKGSKVTITGKLLKFMKNGEVITEVKNADVEILEQGGGSTPGGDAIAISCAKAVELCNALDDGATSEETYSITGYITDVFETVSRGQQSFWLSDQNDGQKMVQAYWANLPEGVESFTKGSKVTITGKLLKFVKNGEVITEIKNADVEILEQGGGENPGGENPGGENPGGENPGGDTPDAGSLLSNGGFETWTSANSPANWKTACTAGNATLSQSTDAHSGQYSVSVGANSTSNKRLGYQETVLEAGTYVFTFFAKSTKSDKSQTRAGYVPVKDGSVGQYVYGDYANLKSGSWTEVTYEFELKEKTTVCLVIMNPKNSSYSESQDILIDDAKLVKK